MQPVALYDPFGPYSNISMEQSLQGTRIGCNFICESIDSGDMRVIFDPIYDSVDFFSGGIALRKPALD
ncbi:hypothetical protein D3C76_1790340 [compost metagenome]